MLLPISVGIIGWKLFHQLRFSLYSPFLIQLNWWFKVDCRFTLLFRSQMMYMSVDIFPGHIFLSSFFMHCYIFFFFFPCPNFLIVSDAHKCILMLKMQNNLNGNIRLLSFCRVLYCIYIYFLFLELCIKHIVMTTSFMWCISNDFSLTW